MFDVRCSMIFLALASRPRKVAISGSAAPLQFGRDVSNTGSGQKHRTTEDGLFFGRAGFFEAQRGPSSIFGMEKVRRFGRWTDKLAMTHG